MPNEKHSVGSDDHPNVFRLMDLAVHEIMADTNPDPDEVAHMEWLNRHLDEETTTVASIPRKIE